MKFIITIALLIPTFANAISICGDVLSIDTDRKTVRMNSVQEADITFIHMSDEVLADAQKAKADQNLNLCIYSDSMDTTSYSYLQEQLSCEHNGEKIDTLDRHPEDSNYICTLSGEWLRD